MLFSKKTLKRAAALVLASVMFVGSCIPVSATRSTPRVLVPTAGGTQVISSGPASIDITNASEGYVVASYSGGCPKVKFQLTGPNGVKYTYNLHGGAEVFPLVAGSGNYEVGIFENIAGNRYSVCMQTNISVNIVNGFGPYLYPNQYVNFNQGSAAVMKGQQLAAGCPGDIDVIKNVYDFVTGNIRYDYNKASAVQSGYISNVDATLSGGSGICLDYAALMASMLRSNGIPTRLEVGYAGTAYHAWISTYLQDAGWVNGVIQFNGNSWSLMDPTFAANCSEKTIKNYIGNGSNYQIKYVY